jgi:hypothetical protein
MENLLPLFVAVTAIAVVIQAGILVALFVAVRKSATSIESLAIEFKTKTLPTVETAQRMLVDLRPKVENIVGNLDSSATLVRSQIERLDATVSDVVDRTRLQVIRADELVNRTLDRVEETSDMVHRTVISPIRQVSGIMQGLSAGLEFFLGRRRRQSRDGVGVPQDELFI